MVLETDPMKNLKTKAGDIFRKRTGVGLHAAWLIPLTLAVLGAAAGLVLPKYEASALLQFPEASLPLLKQEPKPALEFTEINSIELPAYKRVAAAYESVTRLQAYFEAIEKADEVAAQRLVKQAADPSFWTRVAQPVLPFSRRDQKTFGDIKGVSGATVIGLELTADARTEAIAQQMISLLADYYVYAVVRERIRSWALSGKVDAQALEKRVRADVVRAELDIELHRRRAEDMKAILTRYPEAAKMDARQIVSVNPSEGGERYLSPLAQLVGAESAISQRRELITRWQRELKQREVLAIYFNAAEKLIAPEADVGKLIAELRMLAARSFDVGETSQEWVKEAAFSVEAALDNFDSLRSQFGLRNSVRSGALASRDPLRLGLLGAALGIVLLAAIAVLRLSVLSARPERQQDDELESGDRRL